MWTWASLFLWICSSPALFLKPLPVLQPTDFPIVRAPFRGFKLQRTWYRFEVYRNVCISQWQWWNVTHRPPDALGPLRRPRHGVARHIPLATLLVQFFPGGDSNLGHFFFSFTQYIIALHYLTPNISYLLLPFGSPYPGFDCAAGGHGYFRFSDGKPYAPRPHPSHFILAQFAALAQNWGERRLVVNQVGCPGWASTLCFQELWLPRRAWGKAGIRLYDNIAEGPRNIPLSGVKALRAFRASTLASLGVPERAPDATRAHVCLYLRRHRRRPCANPEETVRLLEALQAQFKYTYEVLDEWLDRLDPAYEDQIRKFHSCDIFLSNHGTAIWNTLWMPPGAVVVQVPGCMSFWFLGPLSSHLSIVSRLHWVIGPAPDHCAEGTPGQLIPWHVSNQSLVAVLLLAHGRMAGPLIDDGVAVALRHKARDREWFGKHGPWGTCDCLMCGARDCSMYSLDLIARSRGSQTLHAPQGGGPT